MNETIVQGTWRGGNYRIWTLHVGKYHPCIDGQTKNVVYAKMVAHSWTVSPRTTLRNTRSCLSFFLKEGEGAQEMAQ